MERELRRYKNILFCVGTGVITFGFWSVIKSIMTMTLQKESWLALMKELVGPDLASIALALMWVIVGVVIGIDLILRVCLGMAARKDGMDMRKRKHRGYLFFVFILILLTAGSLISNFTDLNDLAHLTGLPFTDEVVTMYVDSVLSLVAKSIVDGTSLIMIIELLVAGIKVNQLERAMKKAEAMEGLS